MTQQPHDSSTEPAAADEPHPRPSRSRKLHLVAAVAALGIGASVVAAQRARERAAPVDYAAAVSTWPPGIGHLWTPSRVELSGHDTLLVGDSAVYLWPWPADRLGLWGQPTELIRAAFLRTVTGRRYAQILLWPGTAHFWAGEPVEQYVADVAVMVAHAQTQSDRVVLITPLPTPEHPTTPADGAARVRAQWPDLHIIDLFAWYAEAHATGNWATWSDDGYHLTAAGYTQLQSVLVAGGVEPTVFALPPVPVAH